MKADVKSIYSQWNWRSQLAALWASQRHSHHFGTGYTNCQPGYAFSESAALERLRRQVYDLVRLQEQKGLRYDVNIAGDRPAGAISDDHVLVQGASAALAEIGVKDTLKIGSTDGNVPLSQGCPAVTIGITWGGNAHRLDEFIEVQPVRSGMKQLITLTLAAASYYAGLQA